MTSESNSWLQCRPLCLKRDDVRRLTMTTHPREPFLKFGQDVLVSCSLPRAVRDYQISQAGAVPVSVLHHCYGPPCLPLDGRTSLASCSSKEYVPKRECIRASTLALRPSACPPNQISGSTVLPPFRQGAQSPFLALLPWFLWAARDERAGGRRLSTKDCEGEFCCNCKGATEWQPWVRVRIEAAFADTDHCASEAHNGFFCLC